MASTKLPSLDVDVEIRLSLKIQDKKKRISGKMGLVLHHFFTYSRHLAPGHMSLGIVASYLVG